MLRPVLAISGKDTLASRQRLAKNCSGLFMAIRIAKIAVPMERCCPRGLRSAANDSQNARLEFLTSFDSGSRPTYPIQPVPRIGRVGRSVPIVLADDGSW